MLRRLVADGFGKAEDLNCAETILYGANQAYNLNITPDDLRLAAGFGGGMGIESVCGALTAAVMVLGRMFVKERAHESTKIKELAQELFAAYEAEMGSIVCAPLKQQYRTEEVGCRKVIERAAAILDTIVAREQEESGSQALR